MAIGVEVSNDQEELHGTAAGPEPVVEG
jgi:hypothetical protein